MLVIFFKTVFFAKSFPSFADVTHERDDSIQAKMHQRGEKMSFCDYLYFCVR